MTVPDYYNRVNADLLRVIPPAAGVVLEAGCGTGALAEAYRRINDRVSYFGIEKNPEAARIATSSGRIDRLIIGDLETANPMALDLSAERGLPGLRRRARTSGGPMAVLARLARLVREDGQVLACIPNVQHYSVVVNLMRGRWDYQDEGLLNRTHLRFFTLSGVQDLFARAGLRVHDIQPRLWPGAEPDRFCRVTAPVLTALAIDPASFAAQTRAVQYLVRAVGAAEAPRRMLIWTLFGLAIASEVRVKEPLQFLATIPGVRTRTGTGFNTTS